MYDETDVQFIAETYPDLSWPVEAIADKLDMTKSQVEAIALNYLKMRRPHVRATNNDWRKIWQMAENGGRHAAIAKRLNCSQTAVTYAIKTMLDMTPEEREQAWLRYERLKAIDVSTSDQ